MNRHLILLTVVLVVAAITAASVARGASAAITVAFPDPVRGGASVWRGSDRSLTETRFLRGAIVPTISPNGFGVAFGRTLRGGIDLYVTGVYAGFLQPLAHVTGPQTSLAFSRDGRTVAFAAGGGIRLVSIVPGARVRLLRLPRVWRGSSYTGLAFSRDGRLLAFSRTSGDGRAGTLRNELAVVGVDGRGARTLARNPDPYGAQYRPAFSSDGTRIAFAAADGSLASVAVTGGPALPLTPARPRGSARTDDRPLWSPDGSRIAFTRSPGARGSDVYVVRTDGTELRRLTTTPLPAEPGTPRTGSTALAWSPDGTRVLAFRHDHLAVVDAATGASTAVAATGIRLGVASAVWR